MEDTKLCGPSGFRYHRIPPIVRALGSDSPDLSTPLGRRRLSGCESYLGYLPLPLYVFTERDANRHVVKQMRMVSRSGALPWGAFEEVDTYLSVASPLFTLVTLAPFVDEVELTMAIYEMCGKFTAIKLLPEHERFVIDALKADALPDDGWIPIVVTGDDGSEALSDLWTRPPLMSVDELIQYVKSASGLHGREKLLSCAESVLGVTRSPFEVQMAMCLSRPRRMGGEGFVPTELNKKIQLSARAAELASKRECEVDMFFEGDDAHGPLVIECQGRMVHGAGGLTDADSNRINALQSMGYDVLTFTHEQISDASRYPSTMRLIAQKLGISYIDKTKRLVDKETELRRRLFIDWTSLGLPSAPRTVPKRFRKGV